MQMKPAQFTQAVTLDQYQNLMKIVTYFKDSSEAGAKHCQDREGGSRTEADASLRTKLCCVWYAVCKYQCELHSLQTNFPSSQPLDHLMVNY